MHSCATATGLVAIENNGIGDMVLAANEETGEVAYKEVVRTFANTTDEITHVTVNVGDGELETIDSTPEHPFCVEGKGWVEASSLHAGMTIWFANGTKGTVEDITNEGLEEPVTVYNFEVKDFHTYFVGDSGVLVHNTCGEKTYQTYIKTNPETGEVYVGRTSGTGTPEQNVMARDASHHMNDKGFANAVLDQSSTSYEAIRGREQQLIDYYGGAKSTGGTAGNAINGISATNPKRDTYLDAAKEEFGSIGEKS